MLPHALRMRSCSGDSANGGLSGVVAPVLASALVLPPSDDDDEAGSRPDENKGADEPVTRDAAVAAVATL